jgi:acetyl-CoA synthetase
LTEGRLNEYIEADTVRSSELKEMLMLKGTTYEEVYRNFSWRIPPYFNIGADVCDKWANDKYRLALIDIDPEGREHKYTFWEMKNLSNRFANALRAHGIERGDRVGILLSQCPETAISHVAVYKLGAIALPLLILFGSLAIEHRLRQSEAKALITDKENLPKILEIKENLPHLRTIILTDSQGEQGTLDFWKVIEKSSRYFTPVLTLPDDPALIVFTSGTTGPPKGALHAHRILMVARCYEFCRILSTTEIYSGHLSIGYMGGSFNSCSPRIRIPVVAFRPRKFDPEETLHHAKYSVM